MSTHHFHVPDPILIRLSDVEPKAVDWLWEPYLPKGMLALLSGDPGCGKTFVSLAIGADLSNGLTPCTHKPCAPVNIVYLSLENSAQHVTRPRFDSLGGNCQRFLLLPEAITLDDTSTLEQAIIEADAGLLIVDPIQSYLGADVDLHRSNETRPVLDGLVELAHRFDCCILLVRHLSKSSGGRAIHRGLGSIDITGAARTELMAGSAPSEPNRRAMVQIKSNLGPCGVSLGYKIDDNGFAWTGESDLTTSDLLSADSSSKKQSEVARAVGYLKIALSAGPKLQKELVAQSGFEEWTLQRASRKLSIRKGRMGQGGPWVWSLE